MNKGRRKEIDALIKEVGETQEKFTDWLERFTTLCDEWDTVRDEIRDLANDVQGIQNDEEEYLENMPDALKGGEKGSAAESAVAALNEAYEWLAGVADIDLSADFPEDLSEAVTHLEEAKG